MFGVTLSLGVAMLVVAPVASKDSSIARSGKASQNANNAQVMTTYAQLPISFEPNQGQADQQVDFVARGGGYTLLLTSDEAMLTLRKPAREQGPAEEELVARYLGEGQVSRDRRAVTGDEQEPSSALLSMRMVGASPTAQVAGIEELPGKSNYFIGSDPTKWRTNVPNYAKVQYKDVYPGVDLVYYGNQGQLEYDFVVGPGADPGRINLAFGGEARGKRGRMKRSLRIDSDGDLVINLAGSEVRFHKPVVYQPAANRAAAGAPTAIAGRYVLRTDNQVGFELATYDHSRALVIDPALVYSTYLGGHSDDQAYGIAVDSKGSAYVTGRTTSATFPTRNAYQQHNAGKNDAFVTKFSRTGGALLFSTYLGGTKSDLGEGIAVDSSGNAYVVGYTTSPDFPTKNAFQPNFGGGPDDAFVAKFDSSGGLAFSTYLGGRGDDIGFGIAVDSTGSAWVTGHTGSANFPTTKNAFQQRYAGKIDAFVTKFNPAGSALVFSTFLGGKTAGENGYAITVDSADNAYAAGATKSTDFPTMNAFQPALGGQADSYVVKFDSTGTVAFSTYFGGKTLEFSGGIAADSSGIYLAGGTNSRIGFPIKNAIQKNKSGGYDAFLAKFDPTGQTLIFSTYYGGHANDFAGGVAVDPSGNAHIVGYTLSTDFPTKNPIQPNSGGSWDAFVSAFDPNGTSVIYSTYLGGSQLDFGDGIAMDRSGNAYVTGGTQSTDFPIKNAFQKKNRGGYDAFVTKISP
jgi:hypothetical protein